MFSFSWCDLIQVRTPDHADPDIAAEHRPDRVVAVRPDERLLLLEQGERLVHLGRVGRVDRVTELDEGEAERLLVVVHHRDVALVARVPEGLRARRGCRSPWSCRSRRRWSTRHTGRNTRCPGRSPGPATAAPRLTMFGRSDWSSLRSVPACDEARDVDRDRERQVVAVPVVTELRRRRPRCRRTART